MDRGTSDEHEVNVPELHHTKDARRSRTPARVHGQLLALGISILLFGGCSGPRIGSERAARSDLATVADRYKPHEAKDLPALSDSSSLADYLRFAMLTSPRVAAAYDDWAASVERITPARSLPDPRLTFEADITDTVMALMPGLMVDLSGPGKLRVAGD